MAPDVTKGAPVKATPGSGLRPPPCVCPAVDRAERGHLHSVLDSTDGGFRSDGKAVADDTRALRAWHDVRGLREVRRLARESRPRGLRYPALQPGAPARRLERVPSRPPREVTALRAADSCDRVAGLAAGRAGEGTRDRRGLVVGLPARRAVPGAPRRGGWSGAAHLHA